MAEPEPIDGARALPSGSRSMEGVRLIIAYDGTEFAGWARQPGRRTVQGVLEEAIAAMVGRAVEVRGASRTDAGVHALGQVAAFDAPRSIPMRGWIRGLNAKLPGDVAIVAAENCPVGYTPRFDTVDKCYRYLLLTGPTRDPLLRHRAWFLGPQLARPSARVDGGSAGDWLAFERMHRAAAVLLGTHDFRAFRASDDPRENTVRTLKKLEIIEGFAGDPRLVAIEVVGDAFLKNMVRILVGTLVEVGRERKDAEDVEHLLASGERVEAGPTAPAHGLTLVSVRLGRVTSQIAPATRSEERASEPRSSP
jgi:tRNA pseudouridine38-40 synthase